MSAFTSYGHTFQVADKFAEGHVANAAEAGVLNQQMAEFISHRLRNGIFADLKKGDTPSAGQITEAEQFVTELAGRFEFDMPSEGGNRGLSPLEKLARELAEDKVAKAVAEQGWRVGKRAKSEKKDDAGNIISEAVAEETGDGVYPYSKFRAKVLEYATEPSILAHAQKILSQREKPTGPAVVL